MMFIVVNIDIIYMIAAVVLAFVAGYLFRSAQIIRYRKKITELEEEMLKDHARILELEKEYANLKTKTDQPYNSW